MTGVGHDGMKHASKRSVLEFMIPCMGLGWLAIYTYFM